MTVHLRHGGYLILCPQGWRDLIYILLVNSYPAARASLVAQLVKNLPAVLEILVQFLGQEDPLEKEQVTHSSILGLPLWLSW